MEPKRAASTRGHLPGTDPDSLAVAVVEAGVDDGVRLDVLADGPGEEKGAEFLGGGGAPGHGAEVIRSDVFVVRGLDEQATGDLLKDAGAVGWRDLDKAKVFLGGEAGQGFRRERWCDDGFDEEFGDLLGGGGVDLAVDAEDAAKGGDWVRGEGAGVGLEDGCAGGGAAGIGVLDDDDGGFLEL